ncbi:hypothetical protein ID866_10759, partial [Astraeus odoratus]
MSGPANTTPFHWGNAEQFISLFNLLSLRNGGQLGSRNREDDEVPEVSDDGIHSSASSIGGEDELKQRFLDRFAEVMSCDKGGKYVCCVALRESGDQHAEEDVTISLLVARNSTFSDEDVKFCRTVEMLLRAIAASVYKRTEDFDAVKTALWKELLHYDGPRMDHYVNNLRKNLEAFKHTGLLDGLPPYESTWRSSLNDDKPSTFCDDNGLGSYSRSTHDAYMRFAQNHIADFHHILSSGDQVVQRTLLADKAYSLRHMSSLKLLVSYCPRNDLADNLIADIHFLGRLRSCYGTLIDGAQNIPGFTNLSVILVRNAPPIRPSTLPPLTDAMECLGLTLSPASIRKFVSTKLSVAHAEKNFKRLQKTSRKRLSVHAELQLVLHVAKTMDVDTMNKEVYPYLGCSKLSCFLCASFLKSFGLNGASFRTRGCHGRAYRLWSLPDIKYLPSEMEAMLHSALIEMRNLLVCEMTRPIMSAPQSQVRESSAGLTDVHAPQSAYIHQYHKRLEAQRQFDLMSAKLSARSAWEACETIEEVEASSIPEVAEPPKITTTFGK